MSEPGIPFPMREVPSFGGGPGSFDPRGFGGPSIWPFPSLEVSSRKDGGSYPTPPDGYSQSLGRASYQAKRIGTLVAIQAKGTLGNLHQIADIRQSPNKIFPQQFDFFVYTPTFTLPATRDFDFVETFAFPTNANKVVIHDISGRHIIDIGETPESPPALFAGSVDAAAASLSAFGQGSSLAEAFDNAVEQLPDVNPDTADGFVVYELVKSGRYKGGFIGFSRYFAVVEARFTTIPPAE